MKKLIYILILTALFMACNTDEDPLSIAERNTVSEDGYIPFEELLVLLNVKTSDSTYLVIKSIDSVNIYINGYFWAKLNSQSIDTANINKYSNGNKFQTNNKLNYLIIADQDIEQQPDYSTAGDFAKYLNSAYVLKPGEYACLIESFQVTFNDNTTQKYYPYEYKTFKVEKDLRSASVGEIELKIY